MPVHVHTSPLPSAFFSGVVFFSLEPQNAQISSHWTRLQDTPRTMRSWWVLAVRAQILEQLGNRVLAGAGQPCGST